jgi:hypothetical protein
VEARGWLEERVVTVGTWEGESKKFADLRVLQESEIEGRKHQDDADVHYQPFPESILEEQKIYTNDDGYQRHNVNRDRDVPCHFNHRFKSIKGIKGAWLELF